MSTLSNIATLLAIAAFAILAATEGPWRWLAVLCAGTGLVLVMVANHRLKRERKSGDLDEEFAKLLAASQQHVEEED